MIERIRFGNTGHMSTRSIFGVAALGSMRQAKADAVLDVLGVAFQTIKSVARGRWREADDEPRHSWYRPIRVAIRDDILILGPSRY